MSRRLLLADDSVTIQKVVELVLSDEGFEIKSVNNGEEALAVIQDFAPDIVLCDIEMPVMDGYRLCKSIKTNPYTRDIPVILLAGVFEPVDEGLAKDCGADDRIIKPFESQELISRINSVLALKEGPEVSAVGEEAVESDEAEIFPEEEVVEEGLRASGEVLTEPTGMEYGLGETLIEELEEEPAQGVSAVALEEREEEKKTEPVRMSMPSAEELAEIFRNAVNERVSEFIRSIDIRDSVLSAAAPAVRESVEKAMWEIAPGLIDRLIREMLEGALASLTKEVEKVVWETVPDIAERMVSREIESIRAEIER